MEHKSKARYISALRRKVKTNQTPRTGTLLTGLLSPVDVMERCGADRERIWKAKTIREAVAVGKDVESFWTDYREEHPELARIVLESLCRTANALLEKAKKERVRVPANWLDVGGWLTEIEKVVKRKQTDKFSAEQKLLAVLTTNPDCSISDLAEKAELSRTTPYDCLKFMAAYNTVKANKKGKTYSYDDERDYR